MPEDSKQMGARASNSPQLSLSSVRNAATAVRDFFDGSGDAPEERTVSLGYVSEDDGDIEIGVFGSDEASDDRF